MDNHVLEHLKKFKFKSFYFRLLISLICLMIIPTLFTTIFIYMKSSHNIQQELNSYQLHELQNIKNETNELINNIENVSVQFAMDTTVNYFLNNDFSEDRLASKRLYDSIVSCVFANEYVDSIYIYFNNSGLVMTPIGIYNIKDFYDKGWIDNSKKNKSILIMPPRKIVNINESTKQNNNYVSYIRSVPIGNSSNSGTLVINIKYEEFKKKLKSAVSGDKDIVFMVNKDGDILASSRDEYLNRSLNDILGRNVNTLQGTGYVLDEIQKNRMMVSFTQSTDLGWRFVQIIPLHEANKNITFIKKLTIGVVAITIVLGLVIVFLVSYRMYSPIVFLFSETQKIKNDNSLIEFHNISRNEIDALHEDLKTISKSMLEEKHEKQLLKIQLNETRNEATSKIFQSLINGSHSSSKDLTERLRLLGWSAHDYIIMVISIDHYEVFKSKWSESDQVLWKFGLLNIVDEIINNRFKGIVVERDTNQWVAAINISGYDDIKAGNEAFIVAKEIHNAIKLYCNIFTVTIGIGSFCRELSSIYVSYENAQEAFQNRWIKEGNAIYLYNQDDDVRQAYVACIEEEKNFLYSLKQNDFDMAKQNLQLFIKELILKNNGNRKNVYHGMLLLSVSIIKMLQEIGYSLDEVYASFGYERIDILKQFRSKETLKDVEIWLDDIIKAITDFLWKIRDSKYNLVMNEIKSYIDQNYDKDIYLPYLADKFGIGESLLSRNFKEYVGENFTEYINHLRIAKSKTLLKDTVLNLNEISAKIGYSNLQTFMRTFKKLEGITPGQFRNDAINIDMLKKDI